MLASVGYGATRLGREAGLVSLGVGWIPRIGTMVHEVVDVVSVMHWAAYTVEPIDVV